MLIPNNEQTQHDQSYGDYKSISDEDITLEGTPLHDYLNDLPISENDDLSQLIESHPMFSSSNFPHRMWYGTSLYEYAKMKWQAFRAKFSNYFPVSQDILVKMSQHYYSRYGKEILDSKVILEDDLDYLCLQTPQQFLCATRNHEKDVFLSESTTLFSHGNSSSRVGVDCQNTKYHLLFADTLLRHTVLVSSYIACIIAFLFSPLVPTVVHVCLAMATLFVTCFNIRLQIIAEMWKRNHEANIKALRQFLQTSELFQDLVRRCVKLIQEMETVSRGYKLINGQTPITRLESKLIQSPRAFSKLRLMLLKSLIKCTLSCRNATRKLLEYKLQDDTSSFLDQYYICNIPLTNLGACFVEETSITELHVNTNGYSLAVLKSLDDLLFKQRSELLTRLSLTLSGVTWNFSSDGFLSKFALVLEEPYKTTLDCFSSLGSCYKAHKFVLSEKDKSQSTSDKSKVKTSAMRINLHSLQVHMRAAMHTSMEIEDMLTSGDHISATDSFNSIKRNLEAGLECWEGYAKELSRLMKDDQANSAEQPGFAGDKVEVRSVHQSGGSSVTDVFMDDVDDDLGDKIFEASTSDREDEDYQCRSMDVDESDKRIAEESATVIRELRSVLAVKTSEKQREMWKSQLFPHYKPKSPKQDNNEHKPHSVSDSASLDESPIDHSSNISESEDACQQNLLPSATNSAIPSNSVSQSTGEYVDQKLFFAKKPALPGRLPTLRNRFRRPGHIFSSQSLDSNAESPETTSSTDEDEMCNSKSIPAIVERPDSSEALCKNDDMEWAVGLGLGFSNSLAKQAANMASKRSQGLPLHSETETYECG